MVAGGGAVVAGGGAVVAGGTVEVVVVVVVVEGRLALPLGPRSLPFPPSFLGGGANALPADNGSEARPMRWLTRWLAATEIAAATASPNSARSVQRSQAGTVMPSPGRGRGGNRNVATRSARGPLARPCS